VRDGEAASDYCGREGIKSQSFQELTEAHHAQQQPTLLAGIARTYHPKDEEGEQFPPESW
jgi:hypothetical protein